MPTLSAAIENSHMLAFHALTSGANSPKGLHSHARIPICIRHSGEFARVRTPGCTHWDTVGRSRLRNPIPFLAIDRTLAVHGAR